MTTNPAAVALLLTVTPTPAPPAEWTHDDGTTVTVAEAELLGSATWADLAAAGDLLAAALDHERTQLDKVRLALLDADLDGRRD